MKRAFINISGSPVYRAAAEYTIKNCSADWRREFYPLLRSTLQHFSSFKRNFQVKLFHSCPDFRHCLIFISAFNLALSLFFFHSSNNQLFSVLYRTWNCRLINSGQSYLITLEKTVT